MERNTDDHGPGNHGPSNQDGRDKADWEQVDWLMASGNRTVVKRFGLFLVIALLVGFVAPSAITPVMVGNMMLFAGLATVIVALVSGESIRKKVLGRWDEAAGYLLIALIAAQTVDPAALEALQQQRAQ